MNVRCHPERSARKEFPTRLFCGAGGRRVEGPRGASRQSLARDGKKFMPMSQTLHYPLRYCKNIPWTPGKFYRPVPFRTVGCIRQFGGQRATDGWNVSSAASLASFVSSHAMRRR